MSLSSEPCGCWHAGCYLAVDDDGFCDSHGYSPDTILDVAKGFALRGAKSIAADELESALDWLEAAASLVKDAMRS